MTMKSLKIIAILIATVIAATVAVTVTLPALNVTTESALNFTTTNVTVAPLNETEQTITTSPTVGRFKPTLPESAALAYKRRKEQKKNIAKNPYEDVPPLTFAASSGAVAEVEGLLEAGVDPDELDWLGQTALHMACKFQQFEATRVLLGYGANLSIANVEYEETALHLAAKMGQTDIMQLLMDYGAEIDAQISPELIPGGTPLTYAALYDSHASNALKLLLDRGANVEGRNSYHETALHISVNNQNIRNVQLLLGTYKAQVDALDGDGCTPLNTFARDNTANSQLGIIGLLLEYGANIEARCRKSQRTPLHNAVASMNVPIVDYLLKHGADVEAVDARGLTPLYTAVAETGEIGPNHGHMNTKLNIIRMLLQHGANPNAGSRMNKTLSESQIVQHDDHRSSVLETTTEDRWQGYVLFDEPWKDPGNSAPASNKIGVLPKNCLTVLLGFAMKGSKHYKEIAKLLVAYGAQLNASKTICPEHDPVHIAVLSGHKELSDFLWMLTVEQKKTLGPISDIFAADPLAKLFDIPPFMMATYSGDMARVARLLVAPLKSRKTTLLGRSSFRNNGTKTTPASNLTPQSTMATVKATDYMGRNALHAAAMCNSLSVARVLLHLGADANSADQNGCTPMHVAARKGDIDMMKLLLDHGAKLEPLASEGTPLSYAVIHSNSHEAVKFLLERGSDPLTPHSGPSLLHIAAQRQNIRMMELLLQYGHPIDAKTSQTGLTAFALLIESDCCYPQLPVLSFLLDHGANIDTVDVNMRTPLNAALALRKRKEVVFFLLSRGANPNSVNIRGCNAPLYRVVSNAHNKIQRYYRHSMADDEDVRLGQVVDIVKALLKYGADPNYVDKCNRETASDAAFYTGQREVVDVLQAAIEARTVPTTPTPSVKVESTPASNETVTTTSSLVVSTLKKIALMDRENGGVNEDDDEAEKNNVNQSLIAKIIELLNV